MFSMILPSTKRLLPVLVAAALLALPACGFRGPLYLPGEAPPGTETPAQATENEAANLSVTTPAQIGAQVGAEDAAKDGDNQENDGEEGDGDPSAPASL